MTLNLLLDPSINIEAAELESLSLKTLDPCNVFVKYLPSALDDEELCKLFQPYGAILSSKIMVDPNSHKSLGFGFVRFSSADEAGKAIVSMNGHRLGNKRLLCKLAYSSKEKEQRPTVSPGKAPSDDSPRSLPRSHAHTHPILHSAPTHNYASTTSIASPSNPGFAPSTVASMASFAHRSGAAASSSSVPRSSSSPALRSRHGSVTTKRPSNNLYIKALLPEDTEETLIELFGRFGNIVACKIMVDKQTGQSRQIGFVQFDTLGNATAAMHVMNGMPRGTGKLSVTYADDDQEKLRRKLNRTLPAGSSPAVLSPIMSAQNYNQMGLHSHSDARTAELGRRGGHQPVTPSLMPVQWSAPYQVVPAMFPSYFDPATGQYFVMYPTAESYPAPQRPMEVLPTFGGYPGMPPGLFFAGPQSTSLDSNAPDTHPAGEESSQATPTTTRSSTTHLPKELHQ